MSSSACLRRPHGVAASSPARYDYRVSTGLVLLETHEAFLEHLPRGGHPERPARLEAVLTGIRDAGVTEALVPATPRAATRVELERVHSPGYLDAVERFCERGG